MADLLSGSQMLEKQAEYLRREKDQHKRDIITNQGKVQEIEELLTRVENTCLHCGEFIFPTFRDNENRMDDHIMTKHTEEREPEST